MFSLKNIIVAYFFTDAGADSKTKIVFESENEVTNLELVVPNKSVVKRWFGRWF